MCIASFQDRYQALANCLDAKGIATDRLTVQKKPGFCKKVIKLFILIVSLGMIDPYRHVRVGRVAKAIFEDCKKNIAELQDPNKVNLVLEVLGKLKQTNPKKFGSVYELYSYAIIGMGKPKAPSDTKNDDLVSGGAKNPSSPPSTPKVPVPPTPVTSGNAPPPPPLPPLHKSSPTLVISPKPPAKLPPGEYPKTATVPTATQILAGRAGLKQTNTTASSPSTTTNPNPAAEALARLGTGKK